METVIENILKLCFVIQNGIKCFRFSSLGRTEWAMEISACDSRGRRDQILVREGKVAEEKNDRNQVHQN